MFLTNEFGDWNRSVLPGTVFLSRLWVDHLFWFCLQPIRGSHARIVKRISAKEKFRGAKSIYATFEFCIVHDQVSWESIVCDVDTCTGPLSSVSKTTASIITALLLAHQWPVRLMSSSLSKFYIRILSEVLQESESVRLRGQDIVLCWLSTKYTVCRVTRAVVSLTPPYTHVFQYVWDYGMPDGRPSTALHNLHCGQATGQKLLRSHMAATDHRFCWLTVIFAVVTRRRRLYS